jgi:biopolymer transport protein ExbD
MKRLLFVCLIAGASVMTAAAPSLFGQSDASHAGRGMQQGISVQLAVASDAQPAPAADDQDAWIVTVRDDGSLYFGTKLVTAEDLAQYMISHPRSREQKLYIKADARTRYASVERALAASRAAEFEAPVLLTAREGTPKTQSRMEPAGLEVWIGSSAAEAQSTVVDVRFSPQGPPVVRINDQAVSWDHFLATLSLLLQERKANTVLVTADDRLEFAEIVRLIDACRSAGARVILHVPTTSG